MSAAPKKAARSREQHEKDLDKHFRERREAGLPAHRPQEFHAAANGVEVHTLERVVYVKTDGETRLDQAGVATLIGQLQAAFQAVS